MYQVGSLHAAGQGGAAFAGLRTAGEWLEALPGISRAFFDFEICRREAATEPHIYLNFARGLLALGPGLELYAVEAARTYTMLAPRDPEGYKTLGAAYGALGALRDAAACYETAAEIDPEDEGAATSAIYLYVIMRACLIAPSDARNPA